MASSRTAEQIASVHAITQLHKLVYVFDKTSSRLLNDELNITFSQVMILHAVDHCPCLTQRAVAEFVGVTPAAVCRHIDALHERGLLTRKENKENRRESKLELTAKGEQLLERSRQLLVEHIQQMQAQLSTSQQKSFVDSCECMLNAVA